jgi:UDP-GlcNAc:undecaprenyl-phosphate GlcNAc-1-phosphate transferase
MQGPILVVMAAMVPYLMCNLEIWRCRGRKVFLGDAGSMLLGYFVVWTIITASQNAGAMSPVTALWVIALPLMDTINVMGRRMLRGNSPFTADKCHLHHLLARIYGSTRTALLLMLLAAMSLAGMGAGGQLAGVSEPVMFGGGVGVFLAYVAVQRHAQRLYMSMLRRRRQQQPLAEAA